MTPSALFALTVCMAVAVAFGVFVAGVFLLIAIYTVEEFSTDLAGNRTPGRALMAVAFIVALCLGVLTGAARHVFSHEHLVMTTHGER